MKNSKSPVGTLALLALTCAIPMLISQISFGGYIVSNPAEWVKTQKLEDYYGVTKINGRDYATAVPVVELWSAEVGKLTDKARHIPTPWFMDNIQLKDNNPELKVTLSPGQGSHKGDELIEEKIYLKRGSKEVLRLSDRNAKLVLTPNQLFSICGGKTLDICKLNVAMEEYNSILFNSDMGKAKLDLEAAFKRGKAEEAHAFTNSTGARVTFRLSRHTLARPTEISSLENHVVNRGEEPVDHDLGPIAAVKKPEAPKPKKVAKRVYQPKEEEGSEFESLQSRMYVPDGEAIMDPNN